MTKIKLTKTTVEKLPHTDKGKQVDYYDSELDGFGIRVSATSKKYFVRRLIGIKRVRVMIGNRGPWEGIESTIRKMAKDRGDIYVV